MTLQQLKYVATVADKPSMCEAAKELFISQPSLSNAIKELEQDIGITIFARTNKGIVITPEGREFLGYARQVLEQTALLEAKYKGMKLFKQKFSVATQHYSFAVSAFANLLEQLEGDEYDFSLREIRTYEIIESVKDMQSEIGILYLNAFNEKVICKLLKESELQFEELFVAKPHVFMSVNNPLSKKKKVKIENLQDYPYLCFEQGEYNSFYFSEEILSTIEYKKKITVSDRATLFNLLISSNGFTLSTGIIDSNLNRSEIIAIPLESDEYMQVGIITRKNVIISNLGRMYIDELKKYVKI